MLYSDQARRTNTYYLHRGQYLDCKVDGIRVPQRFLCYVLKTPFQIVLHLERRLGAALFFPKNISCVLG